MLKSRENTEICTLSETTFRLKAGAIHLHCGVLKRLWRQEFDNENGFGLGQLLGINTNDSHLTCNFRSVLRR